MIDRPRRGLIPLLLLALAGCAPQQQLARGDAAHCSPEQPAAQDSHARMDYLKSQALAARQPVEKLQRFDSVYALMSALQDGKLHTEALHDSAFYFDDSLGADHGYYHNSQYFICIQAIEAGEVKSSSGEALPLYVALYKNSKIDMTVTVYWMGRRPLVGQRLNTDFLQFHKAGSYKSAKGTDMTEIVFWRPQWAGDNGATAALAPAAQ